MYICMRMRAYIYVHIYDVKVNYTEILNAISLIFFYSEDVKYMNVCAMGIAYMYVYIYYRSLSDQKTYQGKNQSMKKRHKW